VSVQKFKGSTPSRVVLLVGDQPPFNDEKILITVDRPSDGDFSHALDLVFADGLAELAPTLPPYWQRFAREAFSPGPSVTFTPGVASANGTGAPVPVKKLGGGIKAPVLLKSNEPEFSYAARNLRYSGKALVNLWVDANGIPTHLAVAKPAGLGLDEQALYSVQQYRFKPATENGQPVVVELNVEVNFEID
jgi:TonB family protein